MIGDSYRRKREGSRDYFDDLDFRTSKKRSHFCDSIIITTLNVVEKI